jgi:hypothetical protein
MLVPNTDALFIHIPKTGGISIGIALGIYTSKSKWRMYAGVNHGNPNQVNQEWARSQFRFTFVRNTWDRVLSEYLFRREAWQHNPSDHRARQVKHIFEHDNGDVGTFLELLEKGGWWHPNNTKGHHIFRTQLFWLMNEHEVPWGYDFIGRFENFENDFNKITQLIGLDAKLEHYNATKRGLYREHYNSKARDIVARLYRKEIRYLGYDF